MCTKQQQKYKNTLSRPGVYKTAITKIQHPITVRCVQNSNNKNTTPHHGQVNNKNTKTPHHGQVCTKQQQQKYNTPSRSGVCKTATTKIQHPITVRCVQNSNNKNTTPHHGQVCTKQQQQKYNTPSWSGVCKTATTKIQHPITVRCVQNSNNKITTPHHSQVNNKNTKTPHHGQVCTKQQQQKYNTPSRSGVCKTATTKIQHPITARCVQTNSNKIQKHPIMAMSFQQQKYKNTSSV